MCILIEQQLLMTLIALKLYCAVLCLVTVVFDSVQPHDAVHQASLFMGILQARMLEWVAMPFSRGTSQTRNQMGVSCTAGRFFTG